MAGSSRRNGGKNGSVSVSPQVSQRDPQQQRTRTGSTSDEDNVRHVDRGVGGEVKEVSEAGEGDHRNAESRRLVRETPKPRRGEGE